MRPLTVSYSELKTAAATVGSGILFEIIPNGFRLVTNYHGITVESIIRSPQDQADIDDFVANVQPAANNFSIPVPLLAASISGTPTVISVSNSSTALPTTPLVNRNTILVQNQSNGSVLIGTSGNELLLVDSGDAVSLSLTEDILLFGVKVSGANKDVLVWEFA